MTLTWRRLCSVAGLWIVLASPALAQDLDPRAYVHVPVNGTFVICGLGFSDGDIVTDPTFAVSQPIRQNWLLDAYAGVWFFTANPESYPGTLRKTQSPLGSFQGHVSYNFSRKTWAAFDVTYYVGGRTTVEGVAPTDLQNNLRTGGTLAVGVGQRHSIKIAASRGAIVRLGTNFTSVSVAWQTAWAPRPTPAPRLTSR